MNDASYQPGACNIGPAEIARRRNAGWVGLAVTIGSFATLVWTNRNPWWRLLLFLPASLSASGFLQARSRFCSGFARQGVFNFGAPGKTQAVPDDDARAADQKKAARINLVTLAIGAATAVIAVAIGRVRS